MKTTAVLVCPGKSFVPATIPDLHKIGDVYTVNRSIRAWMGTSFIPVGAFAMDSIVEFPEEQPLFARPEIRKFTNSKHELAWANYPNVELIKIHHTKSKALSQRKIVSTPTSLGSDEYAGYYATTPMGLWRLFRMNKYKQIYIVGCDCTEGYYFDANLDRATRTKRVFSAKRYGMVYSQIKAWHNAFTLRGIKLINTTKQSMLADFLPTISIEEIIGIKENKIIRDQKSKSVVIR